MLHFTHFKISFIWFSQGKSKSRETDFSAVSQKEKCVASTCVALHLFIQLLALAIVSTFIEI